MRWQRGTHHAQKPVMEIVVNIEMNLFQAKALCKELKFSAELLGFETQLAEWHESIASSLGFKNWNTAHAQLLASTHRERITVVVLATRTAGKLNARFLTSSTFRQDTGALLQHLLPDLPQGGSAKFSRPDIEGRTLPRPHSFVIEQHSGFEEDGEIETQRITIGDPEASRSRRGDLTPYRIRINGPTQAQEYEAYAWFLSINPASQEGKPESELPTWSGDSRETLDAWLKRGKMTVTTPRHCLRLDWVTWPKGLQTAVLCTEGSREHEDTGEIMTQEEVDRKNALQGVSRLDSIEIAKEVEAEWEERFHSCEGY